MRYSLPALAFVLSLFVSYVAQTQEPPIYKAGTLCTPRGDVVKGRQTSDHPCHCKRMDADPTCEGEPTHDPVCKQWCHEDHCGCPVVCATGKGT